MELPHTPELENGPFEFQVSEMSHTPTDQCKESLMVNTANVGGDTDEGKGQREGWDREVGPHLSGGEIHNSF